MYKNITPAVLERISNTSNIHAWDCFGLLLGFGKYGQNLEIIKLAWEKLLLTNVHQDKEFLSNQDDLINATFALAQVDPSFKGYEQIWKAIVENLNPDKSYIDGLSLLEKL